MPKIFFMGKGDRKSKKGKIFMGSYGKTRPRKWKKSKPVATASAAPAAEEKQKAVKKKPAAAPKKKKKEEQSPE